MTRAKYISFATLATIAYSGSAFAQGMITPTPEQAPPVPVVGPVAPPSTQPAPPIVSTPVTAPANQRVLVIPFVAYNVPDNEQWIPKAVQEDLVAALGGTHALSPVPFQGQVIVEDNATAAHLAKNASAGYAVRGAAQIVNGTVRITAQLINADNGETVNTASVTGPMNALLAMEDGLAAQLLGLPANAAPNPATVGQTPVAPQPSAEEAAAAPAASSPQIIIVPTGQSSYAPAYAPSYPDYSDYGYGYDPYYSYGGYPYYYGGFYPGYWYGSIVYINHNHDHDHDHGHGGNWGGGNWGGGHDGMNGGHLNGGGFNNGGFNGGGGPSILRTGGGGFNSGGLPIPNHGAPLPVLGGNSRSLSFPVHSGFSVGGPPGLSGSTFGAAGGMTRGGGGGGGGGGFRR